MRFDRPHSAAVTASALARTKFLYLVSRLDILAGCRGRLLPPGSSRFDSTSVSGLARKFRAAG